MDLSQSQEQDKIIQYYLNQQIKKVADEKSQLHSQLEQERNKIKLQVWELINQKEQQVQQVQEIQQSRFGATPLSLISNNSAQSDRFDIPLDRSKLKQQSSKFEQSMPSQKEQQGFQMTYHSFIEPTNKDSKYKQLDQLIAQYEEKTKNLPRNYFLKDQGSSQLQQDHEDDQYDQEFDQDEDIQEIIEEDLQESQVQVESQSIKQNKLDNINAYNNLSRLRVDRLDTSMATADNKLNEMSRLSESLSDLNVNETNKILEISKQIDAIKLSKFDQTLQYTKDKDDKLDLSNQASKLIEMSQQQSKFLQRLDYPQMPSLDQNFSYQVSEQSQLGMTQKYFIEQSKYIDQKQGNEQSQYKLITNQRSQIEQQSKIENQGQQNSKFNNQMNSEFQEKSMDYNQQSFQQQTKATDQSHLPSKMSEPTKRNQQSEFGRLNYFPNQTCANSNAKSNKQPISDSANKEEEFQFQFEDNHNENQFAEEEEVFSEEEDDHNNKFYQFSIKFEDQDEKEKLKKFEALKKKKIQEMEELRQLRQIRNKDNNNNNNKRDPSPLMPSASLKRLQPQFQQPQQLQPQQYQQPQRNIFQEQPSPVPVPQAKRTTSANRKSPMARQKETAHFNDIDRSISVEKNKQNNKKMLKNAITYVCLAGEPNRKERESILQKLDGVEAEHFILLFKTYGRSDFRGLYGYAVDSQPYLIFGQGKCPQLLTPDMVKTFYKYDSGAKQFKAIDGNKQFTIMVDAVQLRK